MIARIVAAAAALSIAAALPAGAQTYPDHPITMIVPLAPGGSTDTLGRLMAKAMSATLGQTVVVENVSGAAGTIGVTRAERSTPDGYTVLWGMWGTNVADGAIYNLGFDYLTDFEPVALAVTQPFLIDARKTMPANNLQELVAWIKANPDKVTMGTSGVGSPSHVAGVLMENMIGVKWQMVSYRSAGLATQDLLGGVTDIQLDTPAVSLPHVKSGDLKAYAVTAKERIAVAPDIPTTDEAGLPGYYFSFWHAMWAPRARRSRSSPSLTPRWWPPWPIPIRGKNSSISRRSSIRASNRHPKRCTPSRKPRSRNGGRSSRPPASRRSKKPGSARYWFGA